MNDDLNDIDVLEEDEDEDEENLENIKLSEIAIDDSMPPELKEAISNFNSYVSSSNEPSNNEVSLSDVDEEDNENAVSGIESDIAENDVEVNMDDIF